LSKKTDKKTGEVTWSVPDTDKNKAYLFELAAQRINGEAGDNFQTFDMMRGERDEVDAFNLYSEKYEQLKTCGFITNDEHNVLLGFSPDGLSALHDDSMIEAKSRKPKFQVETMLGRVIPDEYEIQVQTGLLITRRKKCDFISYCGGMEMIVFPVYPDPQLQDTIILAAQQADKQVNDIVVKYRALAEQGKFPKTIKRVEDITA